MLGGTQPAKERRAPAKQPLTPALKDLAARMSDAFDTRVRVEVGRRKGKIVVEFASLEDLDRIVKTISSAPGPNHPALSQRNRGRSAA